MLEEHGSSRSTRQSRTCRVEPSGIWAYLMIAHAHTLYTLQAYVSLSSVRRCNTVCLQNDGVNYCRQNEVTVTTCRLTFTDQQLDKQGYWNWMNDLQKWRRFLWNINRIFTLHSQQTTRRHYAVIWTAIFVNTSWPERLSSPLPPANFLWQLHGAIDFKANLC